MSETDEDFMRRPIWEPHYGEQPLTLIAVGTILGVEEPDGSMWVPYGKYRVLQAPPTQRA